MLTLRSSLESDCGDCETCRHTPEEAQNVPVHLADYTVPGRIFSPLPLPTRAANERVLVSWQVDEQSGPRLKPEKSCPLRTNQPWDVRKTTNRPIVEQLSS